MTSEILHHLEDYKEFIRRRIAENSSTKAYQTLLAKAAGCQKSFLSQALNSHIHLTPDHAAGMVRFWKMDEQDARYFLDLVLYARAGSQSLRSVIETRLKEAREQRQRVATRFIDSKKLTLEELTRYYSTWYYTAIHILLSVPGYQTVDKIAGRVNLPIELVTHTLEDLEQMKLVKRKTGGWEIQTHDLFLPNGSPLIEAYHAIWRQKAAVQMQLKERDSIHFTYLYAMSNADIQNMKDRLLAFISESRKAMLESPEEDLVCFTCDFFRV